VTSIGNSHSLGSQILHRLQTGGGIRHLG
jgi:hypothetical protein